MRPHKIIQQCHTHPCISLHYLCNTQSAYTTTTFIFPGEPGSAGSLSDFFLRLLRKKTSGNKWHRIYYRLDVHHGIQSRALKHWRKFTTHKCTVPFLILVVVNIPHHHNRLMAFFQDHQGEPVPEGNFWTLWCKGRSTEAETLTIGLAATPSRLTSAHLHQPPHHCFTGRMPFLPPNLQCQSSEGK